MCSGVTCHAAADVRLKEGKIHQVPVSSDAPAMVGDHMLMYSDNVISSDLSGRIHGLPGVVDTRTRHRLVMATEGAIDVKRGQSLGQLRSMYELPRDGSDVEVGSVAGD